VRNVHAVPVRTEEITRSVDGVSQALLVEYQHQVGSPVRLVRGRRLGGSSAVLLEVAFEHAARPRSG